MRAPPASRYKGAGGRPDGGTGIRLVYLVETRQIRCIDYSALYYYFICHPTIADVSNKNSYADCTNFENKYSA